MRASIYNRTIFGGHQTNITLQRVFKGEVLCSRLGGRRALSANTSSSSHLRESPLQSNLSAIWSVERTRRSILLAALSGSFARVEAREAFTTNLRPLPIGRLRPILKQIISRPTIAALRKDFLANGTDWIVKKPRAIVRDPEALIIKLGAFRPAVLRDEQETSLWIIRNLFRHPWPSRCR